MKHETEVDVWMLSSISSCNVNKPELCVLLEPVALADNGFPAAGVNM